MSAQTPSLRRYLQMAWVTGHGRPLGLIWGPREVHLSIRRPSGAAVWSKAMVPTTYLPHVCLASYSAHASKTWSQSNSKYVTKARASRRQMSRSWRLNIEVPEKKKSERECECRRCCGAPISGRRSFRKLSSWRVTRSRTSTSHCRRNTTGARSW